MIKALHESVGDGGTMRYNAVARTLERQLFWVGVSAADPAEVPNI